MTDITKDLLRELHDATKVIEQPKLFAEWERVVDVPADTTKKKSVIVSTDCTGCGRKYDTAEGINVRCKVCLGTEGKFLKALREHVEMIFDKKFISGSPMWTYDEALKRRHSLHLYNDELKIVFDFGKKRNVVVETCARAQYAYVRVSTPKLTMLNYNFIRDHLTSLYISDVYIAGVLKRLEDLYADELTMFATERKNEVALGFTLNTETLKHLILIGSFRHVRFK